MFVFAPLAERFRRSFLALLQRGLTPEKLAFTVAVGFAIGILPVLGTTTFLCVVFAAAFRLNHVATQSANHMAYPLQLGLLIPFYRLGEWLFHAPQLKITVEGVKQLVHSGVLNAIHVLWDTTWRAVAGWALIAPLLIAMIYLGTRPLFSRLLRAHPTPENP